MRAVHSYYVRREVSQHNLSMCNCHLLVFIVDRSNGLECQMVGCMLHVKHFILLHLNAMCLLIKYRIASWTDTPAVSVLITMALYRYFQTSDESTMVPDPHSPLSRLVPSSSIASANEKVKDSWKNEERTAGRNGTRYLKISQELKADISRWAAEHSVAATVRFYMQKLPDHILKESSVRTGRDAYTREMQTSSALTCHQIRFPVSFPASFWHTARSRRG